MEMPNERLRALLLERQVTLAKLAASVQVDPKTIERWIVAGRDGVPASPVRRRGVLRRR
jgi:predicted DNA-binding transcriptional regulator YafY